jgi:hypothetical protein
MTRKKQSLFLYLQQKSNSLDTSDAAFYHHQF